MPRPRSLLAAALMVLTGPLAGAAAGVGPSPPPTGPTEAAGMPAGAIEVGRGRPADEVGSRMMANGALPIEGTEWQLIELDGEAVTTPPDAALTLLLDPDAKRVGGYSGVNRFNGGYQLDGNRLTFGLMAMTMRAGPPALMAQEAAVHQALGATTEAEVVGTTLELRAGDRVLARYRAR